MCRDPGSRSVGTRTLRTPGRKKTVGRSVTLRAARNKGRRLGKSARCWGAYVRKGNGKSRSERGGLRSEPGGTA
jgi:hypothetical protein